MNSQQEMIEGLDLSLDDFDNNFKRKEKIADSVGQIGDVLTPKKSTESLTTSDDDFCLAPGVNTKPMQINVYCFICAKK